MNKPPSKPKKINWVTARLAYESGKYSQQGLADKLGVSRKTVERRAAKGQWVQSVREVARKVSEKVSEKYIGNEVERILSSLDVFDLIISQGSEHLKHIDPKSWEGVATQMLKAAQLKHEILNGNQNSETVSLTIQHSNAEAEPE